MSAVTVRRCVYCFCSVFLFPVLFANLLLGALLVFLVRFRFGIWDYDLFFRIIPPWPKGHSHDV